MESDIDIVSSLNAEKLGLFITSPVCKIQFPSDSDLCFSESNRIELDGRAKKLIFLIQGTIIGAFDQKLIT